MGTLRDRDQERDYVSYLLRMWQDSGDEERFRSKDAAWRATLQSPSTGQRIGFGDLEKLFAYLRAQTGGGPVAEEDRRKERNGDGNEKHS